MTKPLQVTYDLEKYHEVSVSGRTTLRLGWAMTHPTKIV